jgi:LMBR1 domain-containing protein 1
VHSPTPLLAVVAIKGNFLLGLNFLIVSLYPIRVGATLMSSFLVNTALILAMSSAVIQFCTSAFASYANSTQIFDVFGNQVRQETAELLSRHLADLQLVL